MKFKIELFGMCFEIKCEKIAPATPIALKKTMGPNDFTTEDEKIPADWVDPEGVRNAGVLPYTDKAQAACLVIIKGSPQGHRFWLSQTEMTIGRDASADLTVNDQSISRQHAKIRVEDGKVTITDLGSGNGTSVNGKKVDKDSTVILAKEDMVKLGNTILKFLPAGELEIVYYSKQSS